MRIRRLNGRMIRGSKQSGWIYTRRPLVTSMKSEAPVCFPFGNHSHARRFLPKRSIYTILAIRNFVQFILDSVDCISMACRAGLALRYVTIMMVVLNGEDAGLEPALLQR